MSVAAIVLLAGAIGVRVLTVPRAAQFAALAVVALWRLAVIYRPGGKSPITPGARKVEES